MRIGTTLKAEPIREVMLFALLTNERAVVPARAIVVQEASLAARIGVEAVDTVLAEESLGDDRCGAQRIRLRR